MIHCIQLYNVVVIVMVEILTLLQSLNNILSSMILMCFVLHAGRKILLIESKLSKILYMYGKCLPIHLWKIKGLYL
jgi:hypothetical protein